MSPGKGSIHRAEATLTFFSLFLLLHWCIGAPVGDNPWREIKVISVVEVKG